MRFPTRTLVGLAIVAACGTSPATDVTVPQPTTTVDPLSVCDVVAEHLAEPQPVDRDVLAAEGHRCGDTVTCEEFRLLRAASLAARGWEIADHSMCRSSAP